MESTNLNEESWCAVRTMILKGESYMLQNFYLKCGQIEDLRTASLDIEMMNC